MVVFFFFFFLFTVTVNRDELQQPLSSLMHFIRVSRSYRPVNNDNDFAAQNRKN